MVACRSSPPLQINQSAAGAAHSKNRLRPRQGLSYLPQSGQVIVVVLKFQRVVFRHSIFNLPTAHGLWYAQPRQPFGDQPCRLGHRPRAQFDQSRASAPSVALPPLFQRAPQRQRQIQTRRCVRRAPRARPPFADLRARRKSMRGVCRLRVSSARGRGPRHAVDAVPSARFLRNRKSHPSKNHPRHPQHRLGCVAKEQHRASSRPGRNDGYFR